MRFAIPDPTEEDLDYVVDMNLYSSSDEDEMAYVPDLSRRRRTKLGQSIREMLLSSDSEGDSYVYPDLDSEDEVGDLLVASSALPWREPARQTPNRKGKAKASSSSSSLPPKHSSSKRNQSSSSSGPSKSMNNTRPRPALPPRRSTTHRWEPSLRELIKDEHPQEFTTWLRSTEEEAFREGYRNAALQKKRLQEIDRNVRQEMQQAAHGKRSREAEELQRMMEGLALRHTREEEDTSKRFLERERKLWDDVDAAIKEAERQLAEQQAAAAAEERRRKEEEAARIAAEEQAALARKAEAEKAAKEKAEAAAKEQAEQEAAEAARKKAEKESQERAAAKAAGSRAVEEWRKWVGVQRTMKEKVINVVKADRAMKSELRQKMRLITRGVGQVVNTRESILRVTNDLHNILHEQMPSPPAPSQPTTLEALPSPQYGYLLSHLSKGLIKQAENEVSAKADAAFPLARIVVGLILRGHGALSSVLVARLVKKCPWIIPYWPQREEGQSREVYEKSTGRGSDESVADYIARMGGICTLYFAILQTPYESLAPTLPAQPSPQQLCDLVVPILRQPAAWTWIATLLRGNTAALPPAAHLLSVLLDTAGFTLLKYHRQTDKLKEAIRKASNDGKITGDSPASRARLALLLESWDKESLKEPKGNKWD